MSKCGTDDKIIISVFIIVTLIVITTYIVYGGSDKVSAAEKSKPEVIITNVTVDIADETDVLPTPANREETYYSEGDAEIIAKTIWGEARGIDSKAEKAAVAWCILNRVDTDGYACGVSVEYVATFPYQFAYDDSNPVTDECLEIAEDVLHRWNAEKNGADNVGRTLPKDYIYFLGDGEHNNYTAEWTVDNPDTPVWNWRLPNPYET